MQLEDLYFSLNSFEVRLERKSGQKSEGVKGGNVRVGGKRRVECIRDKEILGEFFSFFFVSGNEQNLLVRLAEFELFLPI